MKKKPHQAKPLPLSERIAMLLSSQGSVTAADVMMLIEEVETAVAAADAEAAAAREQALDPASAVDVGQASAAVTASELAAARLRAALPTLWARHEQQAAVEYERAWRKDFDAVAARRNALAKQITETYRSFTEELIELLTHIPEVDHDISHINLHAPPDVHDRLPDVMADMPLLAKDLRLPDPKKHRMGESEMIWPSPSNLVARVMATLQAPPGPPRTANGGYDWDREIDERNEKIRTAHERAAAEHAVRDRQRAEAEALEIKRLKEIDRAENIARGWPA